jgi:hypothetical protein
MSCGLSVLYTSGMHYGGVSEPWAEDLGFMRVT